MRVFVRAPDHLGDGVMALPALAWLAAHTDLVVAAPGWGDALYRHLPLQRVDPRRSADAARSAELAVLLKPSLSAAWQARGAPVRVGLPTDHRRLLLSRVVEERTGEHRADSLLRVACAALGEEVPGPALPAFPTEADDAASLPEDLPHGLVLLLPGTRSAETVAWRGFPELARHLGAAALATGGPGDEALLAGLGVRVLPPLALPALGRLALRARAIVGNDSGLPHLCAAALRAAGEDPGRLWVVYASTEAGHTGPPGARAWDGPRPPCWPCYQKRCGIGAPCRDAPVAGLESRL